MKKELYEGKVLLPPSPSVRQDFSRIKNAVKKSNVENSVYLLGGLKNERYPIMRKNLANIVGENKIIDLKAGGNYLRVFNAALEHLENEEDLAISTNPLGAIRHQIYGAAATKDKILDKSSKVYDLNNWEEYFNNPLIAGVELFGLKVDRDCFSEGFNKGFKKKEGYERPTLFGKDFREYGA
ncbi:MAG: hypothetical protein ABEI74_04560 [Candidatus Pacearchaeota archaeon]